MLSVKAINISLGNLAICDVSFEVEKGQYFVLLGASGVGKTVLLETIAGLNQPHKGHIFLNGEDITGKKINKRKIAMVFQDNTLFPHLDVYDNIAYPLRCKGYRDRQIHKRVSSLAEDFTVTALLKRDVKTLSGGESQRICLARALASEPECLLLDEPISSLDVKARPEIRALLREINRNGQTIVHVTHDYTEAVSLGTHIAVMENGRIAQSGTPQQVFLHPQSEFVANFVGIKNFFKGKLEKPETSSNTKIFTCDKLSFSVLTDNPAGYGQICIRSEDVTVGKTKSPGSARNNFHGTIIDIIPAGIAVEVIVDIGLKIAALITAESVDKLELNCGKNVWVSFKAAAIKYIEQERL
ncbi:ABC transporter ATP-binding protein [Planctomycetota bacterium]